MVMGETFIAWISANVKQSGNLFLGGEKGLIIIVALARDLHKVDITQCLERACSTMMSDKNSFT